MDPALKLHLAAIADENHLWQRLEAHLWPAGPTCPDCDQIDVLRLMARRSAAVHWRCATCRIDFRATQATPLHSVSPLPLWVWCCTLLHLRHLRRRFSISAYGPTAPLSRAQHRAAQDVAELLLGEHHPLVEVLLAARLRPWQPPDPEAGGLGPARSETLPRPAPRR